MSGNRKINRILFGTGLAQVTWWKNLVRIQWRPIKRWLQQIIRLWQILMGWICATTRSRPLIRQQRQSLTARGQRCLQWQQEQAKPVLFWDLSTRCWNPSVSVVFFSLWIECPSVSRQWTPSKMSSWRNCWRWTKYMRSKRSMTTSSIWKPRSAFQRCRGFWNARFWQKNRIWCPVHLIWLLWTKPTEAIFLTVKWRKKKSSTIIKMIIWASTSRLSSISMRWKLPWLLRPPCTRPRFSGSRSIPTATVRRLSMAGWWITTLHIWLIRISLKMTHSSRRVKPWRNMTPTPMNFWTVQFWTMKWISMCRSSTAKLFCRIIPARCWKKFRPTWIRKVEKRRWFSQ